MVLAVRTTGDVKGQCISAYSGLHSLAWPWGNKEAMHYLLRPKAGCLVGEINSLQRIEGVLHFARMKGQWKYERRVYDGDLKSKGQKADLE